MAPKKAKTFPPDQCPGYERGPEALGDGSFGAVYEEKCSATGEKVAIKYIAFGKARHPRQPTAKP